MSLSDLQKALETRPKWDIIKHVPMLNNEHHYVRIAEEWFRDFERLFSCFASEYEKCECGKYHCLCCSHYHGVKKGCSWSEDRKLSEAQKEAKP